MIGLHLIVVWPQINKVLPDIKDYIIASNGHIVQSFEIFPNAKDAVAFVQKLYEQNEYEQNRMNKKKDDVLKNISKGVSILVFTMEDGIALFDENRKRYYYPSIRSFKQSLREYIMMQILNQDLSIELFETIHMSDDRMEFDHDILAVRWLRSKANHNSIRIGIVGAGCAASFHAKALEKDNRVQTYIYDIRDDVACSFAIQHNCKMATSFDSLFKTVEAVIVATPPKSHCSIVHDAIDNGVHVLCEKPMAISFQEASKMYAKSRVSGLVCAVGFNYRFFNISNIILDRTIVAPPAQIHIAIKRLFRENYGTGGEGVLSDLGIHLIDYVMYLCNQKIDSETCEVSMKYKNGLDYDTIVKGKTELGVDFTITMARTKQKCDVGFSIIVVGEKNSLSYDAKSCNRYTITEGKKQRIYHLNENCDTADFFDFTDSISRQDAAWVNMIMGLGSQKVASFYDGLVSQKYLDGFLNN